MEDKWYIRYEYPDGRVVQVLEQEDTKRGVRNVMIASGLFVALGIGAGAALGLRIAAGKERSVPMPASGISLAAKVIYLHGFFFSFVNEMYRRYCMEPCWHGLGQELWYF
jgi:hypothetical protein